MATPTSVAVTLAAMLAVTVGCPKPPPAPVINIPPPPPPPLAPCTTPEPLRVTLQASPRINPGEKGEPLAVVVRLYQLKGTTKLQGAGFDDLLDRDKEILGDEIVASQEVTINPGEKLEPPLSRNPEAQYMAAVALFRRPAGTTWRTARRLLAPDPLFCHPGAAQAAKTVGFGSDTSILFLLDENRIDTR